MSGPLRILDVAPWSLDPPRGGSAFRARALLDRLAERHEVRVFSQPRLSERRNVPSGTLASSALVEHRHPGLVSALVAEACRRSWLYQAIPSGAILGAARPRRLVELLRWCDLCLVEYPWQLPACRRLGPGTPLVLMEHNVEAELRRSVARLTGRSPEHNPWVRYVDRLEARAVAAADLVVAVSGADRRALVERYGADPGRVVEVPNGADTTLFAPATPEERSSLRRRLGLPERPTVVYLAAGAKPTNGAGLAWVRRVAARLPGATFLVVGGVADPAVEGNVVATGFVREAAPYVRAADASVAPVEVGGGTKLKVLDALAAALPTVAFPEAVRGTSLRDGEHVLLVPPREEELARALRRTLEDRALAERLGAAGRALVAERYDWDVLARSLERHLVALHAAV